MMENLEEEIEPLRICKVCGKKAFTGEDLLEFRADKRLLHGRTNTCKTCSSEYDNTRYAEKGEHIRATNKIRWNSKTPEQKKEQIARNRAQRVKALGGEEEYVLYTKDKRLQTVYGITLKDLERRLAVITSKCEICSKDLTIDTACVDHNHDTGEVRGLLCSACNTALGFFKDSVNNLANAIDYLNSNGSYHKPKELL